MPVEIPVDLVATGGRLTPPGAAPPPAADAPPPPAVPAAVPPAAPVATPAVDPYEPTPEEVNAFAESVWRGVPYVRGLSLFGGAVAVVFRALSTEEEEAVKVRVLAAVGRGELTTDVMIFERYVDYRLPFAVESLRVGDRHRAFKAPEDPFAADPGALLIELRRFVGADPVYRALYTQFVRFLHEVVYLQAQALDASFWPATRSGGTSPASRPAASGR